MKLRNDQVMQEMWKGMTTGTIAFQNSLHLLRNKRTKDLLNENIYKGFSEERKVLKTEVSSSVETWSDLEICSMRTRHHFYNSWRSTVTSESGISLSQLKGKLQFPSYFSDAADPTRAWMAVDLVSLRLSCRKTVIASSSRGHLYHWSQPHHIWKRTTSGTPDPSLSSQSLLNLDLMPFTGDNSTLPGVLPPWRPAQAHCTHLRQRGSSWELKGGLKEADKYHTLQFRKRLT
jgi:hypothetical protein